MQPRAKVPRASPSTARSRLRERARWSPGWWCKAPFTHGDVLTVSPLGREVRVRSLHVQNRPGDSARAGQRCGVALGGRIAADAVRRGDWLLDPALHAPTARIDATFHLLASEERPLRHWSQTRFHHGASDVAARVALLQDAPLEPGADAFVQLVLDAPVAAAIGDRFVLRAANGERTLGGGRLVDLRPPQRRRKQERRLAQLEAMAHADPAASLAAQLGRWPHYVEREVFIRDRALAGLPDIAGSREAGPFVFDQTTRQQLADSALNAVGAFHERHPRLLGPGLRRVREALEPRLPEAPAMALLEALVAQGTVGREGGALHMTGRRLGLDHADEAVWRRAAPLVGGDARFRPPLLAELTATLGLREFDLARVLRMKAQEGVLAEIGEGRFLLRSALGEVAAFLAELAQGAEHGEFGAAELRDRLHNGRKVAIQILEYFDRQQVTARRGDLRVLDHGRLVRYLGEQPRRSND